MSSKGRLWHSGSGCSSDVFGHAAGEVLKGERDALLKLVQGLRREYEAVQLAKTGQQAELQSIKVSSCGRGLYLR